MVILRSKVLKNLAFKFKVRIFLIFWFKLKDRIILIFWLKVRICLGPKVRIYLGPKI